MNNIAKHDFYFILKVPVFTIFIFILFFTLICFEAQGYNKFNLTKTIHPQDLTAISKNNSVTYKFKNNDNYDIKVSTSSNNSHTNGFITSKIALIKPIFTDAAYNNKFYNFYKKYANVSPKKNITTDLNLLNSKITGHQSGTVANAFAMLQLIKVINGLIMIPKQTYYRI